MKRLRAALLLILLIAAALWCSQVFAGHRPSPRRSYSRPVPAAAHAESERDISTTLAKTQRYHGVTEYRLPEGTRVDIATDGTADNPHLALEVEWAHKWYEAIGQSLYYAMRMNDLRRQSEPVWQPAVIILPDGSPDMEEHLGYCEHVCKAVGIKFFREAAR